MRWIAPSENNAASEAIEKWLKSQAFAGSIPGIN
jgi:hypothetical protein